MNKFKVSENFSLHEFECNHCGVVKLDPRIVEVAQKIRDRFNKPVYINSGYRCEAHNKAVGGSPRSQHLEGKAIDIVVSGVNPIAVHDYCEPWAEGLGRYRTFTHIDVRGHKARWYNA